MYSKRIKENSIKINEILKKESTISTKKIREILTKKSFTLEDVSILIKSFHNKNKRKLIIQQSNKKRQAKWKNKLYLVPPLYISNRCINNCLYCPWRKDNIFQRKCLNLNEFKKEIKVLIKQGYRIIELVLATDPLLSSKDISKYIKLTKDELDKVGGGEVGLNIESSTKKEYEDYRNAKLDFLIQWQETYNKKVYERFHPDKTKKSSFEFRLDSFERAIEAGLDKFGFAFLGGLSNWKEEILHLFLYAKYIEEKYRIKPFIIGTPRWKFSKGQILKKSPIKISDKEWLFISSIYKIIFPESMPWFSTREDFKLSKKLAKGGGALFTIDCSTSVGGYAKKSKYSQFPVYSKKLKEGTSWLSKSGFSPELKFSNVK